MIKLNFVRLKSNMSERKETTKQSETSMNCKICNICKREYEKDICLMVIYEVFKLKDGTYECNTGDSLYVHQFKGLPKDYHEEYEFNLEE